MAAVVRGLSAPPRPSRFWVGRRPRPGRGRTPVRPGGPSIGGGGYTSPASPPPPQWHHEARSRISPVPALTSRQRRRILSHAIWRARRSPAHCGGRGRGQRGRCPPWSQEEMAGPPPPAALALEVGQGAGEGGWQVLSGSGWSSWSSSIRRAGGGAPWAVPVGASCLLPQHSACQELRTRRVSFLSFPHTAGGDRAPLTCPPSQGGPRRAMSG